MTPVSRAAGSLGSKCFSPLFQPAGTDSICVSPNGSNDLGLFSSVLVDPLEKNVKYKLLQQIKSYFGLGGSSVLDLWPVSVQKRWKELNRP